MDVALAGLEELLPFVAVGFAAQLVDGALGMAFGAIANTMLVAMLGVPPAHASYKVHVIKCFTAAASGMSHFIAGNVDVPLLLRLALFGVIGGALGAYGLSQIEAEAVRPFVLAYLMLLGAYLLYRGIRGGMKRHEPRLASPLGLVGGFLDAIGGGGWGPVVSSNLLVQGAMPRKVVGTVNCAEFFVAIAISAAFLAHFGVEAIAGATLGLLIGGILAAPAGALVARFLPARIMLTLVGFVLSVTSAAGILAALA